MSYCILLSVLKLIRNKSFVIYALIHKDGIYILSLVHSAY